MKNKIGETGLKIRLSRLFPAFRQGVGVPPWLVTDKAATMFIDQVDKWLHLLPPIGFAESLDFLQQSPQFEQISKELVREEGKKWAEHNHIPEALLAADRLLCLLDKLWQQRKLAQVSMVLRTLPVLVALFWSPEGNKVMREVARILGCSEVTSAQVFDSYRAAVESGDDATLSKLEQLVADNRTFSPWSSEFSDVAAKVNLPEPRTRLPVTALVSGVLLRILEMEEGNDNGRGDNSEAKAG
jgi:hypothetical protein